MIKHSKLFRHSTQYLLGIYIMVLGLLAVHPWVGEEHHHHDDHVCIKEQTHYHQTKVDCQICHFAFSTAEYSDSYQVEQPIYTQIADLYTMFATNTYSITPYRCLLRGPPIV